VTTSPSSQGPGCLGIIEAGILVDSAIDGAIVSPVRAQVFPERPDVLLVMVPQGTEFSLPPIVPPFTREAVTLAFREVGVDARVHESPLGRWAGAVSKTDNELRAERASRAKHANIIDLASPDLDVRDRAKLLLRKEEIVDERRTLKARIALAEKGIQRLRQCELETLRTTLKERTKEGMAVDRSLSVLRKARLTDGAEEWSARMRRFRDLVRAFMDPKDFKEIDAMAFQGDDADFRHARLRRARRKSDAAWAQFGAVIRKNFSAMVGAGPTTSGGEGWAGSLYGACPVQGEGVVDGRPWYFRARHDEWSFSVAAASDGDPVGIRWGDGEGFVVEGEHENASWMPYAEAWVLIERSIAEMRAGGEK
jgi:hypothetical protein